MRVKNIAGRRRGVTMVEGAIVLSLASLLLLGTIVAALGAFRYQEMAWLARDAARWASVRGGLYQQETGNKAATAQNVYDNVIARKAVILDSARLSYSVTWDEWDATNGPMPVYYDYTNNVWKTNNVTVKVTYSWVPEAFLGTATLTSRSVMPVTY